MAGERGMLALVVIPGDRPLGLGEPIPPMEYGRGTGGTGDGGPGCPTDIRASSIRAASNLA